LCRDAKVRYIQTVTKGRLKERVTYVVLNWSGSMVILRIHRPYLQQTQEEREASNFDDLDSCLKKDDAPTKSSIRPLRTNYKGFSGTFKLI
jgi:hypothetical protein